MYQKHVLPNGLRVITVPRPDTEAVTVLVLVGVGSRYETRATNGVAHFVEHMMFKGTKRRPSSFALSSELDRYGADYNAYTSKDHTGYYIKIASENIELAFDMLSDMLLHSKFDQGELDRERGVILEEIKMYNDNPLMLAPELFERVLFGQDHQLGRSIAGPSEVISKVPRSALTQFVSKNYNPQTTVIAVAGNFNELTEQALVKKVGGYFQFQSKGGRNGPFRPFTVFPTKRRMLLHRKETEQVQLILGTPGFSYVQKERFPLSLLSIVLGGNMSSRLFIRVRERLGLAYFIRAEADSYQDTGSFAIRAGVDPAKMDKALKAIMKELRLIVEKGITRQELADAKLFLRGKMLLGLEDSSALAEWFGRQEVLTGEIVTPHERLKELERVTNADVQRVAKKLFQTSKLYLSVIGPFGEEHGGRFMKLLKV